MEDEVAILSGLLKANLIRKRNGKFTTLSKSFDPQGDFEAGKALRRYWLERSLKYVTQTKSPSTREAPIGQLVFSCSEEVKEKIVDRYSEFFSEIRGIIASDEKAPDQICVLGVQLLNPSKM